MEKYEKKYKETLEKAKTGLKTCCDCAARQMILRIFPELNESEDERIRKELIEALKQLDKEKCPIDTYPYLDWVAWLEKQSVPASSYYIPKHKFKVGDWVVY